MHLIPCCRKKAKTDFKTSVNIIRAFANLKYSTLKGSYNKILNSKGNIQKCKVDRTNKIEKSTERLTQCCHTPDLVQALSEENGGLNQVLRMAKPPTYMTKFIVLYQIAKKVIIKSGVFQ